MTINKHRRPSKRDREEEEPWCLVESDPDVFTEMLHCYGAKDLKVEELYDLDIMPSDTVYGLIFARPCDDETQPRPILSRQDKKDAQAVFFSRQIITNICATLALLGILFNIDHLVCIGDHLTNLKDDLRDANPVLRGNALGNDPLLRETHNSFADAQDRACIEEPPAKSSKGRKGKKKKLVYEDAKMYHYVSFIPLNGYIWELDGFNKYPVKVAKTTEEGWIETVKPILRERMTENDCVDFSLLSIIPGPWVTPSPQLDEDRRNEQVDHGSPPNKHTTSMTKMGKRRLENTRLKHDYVPFIQELIEKIYKNGGEWRVHMEQSSL